MRLIQDQANNGLMSVMTAVGAQLQPLSSDLVHFCHAQSGVHSTKCRHQSPGWTILSHFNYCIQGEVTGFQVLLDSLDPCSTRASWWSPPGDGIINIVDIW